MSDLQRSKKTSAYVVAFALAGEIGLEIAIPAVLFTWIGKRIDLAYGISPRAVIGSFVLAFIVSASIVWKRAQAMKRMYMDEV